MSLVTLIKSADTTLRDAVVQVEDWSLPKEAVFTGKVDEAGRAVFSVLKADAAKVETVVETDEKAVVSDVKKDAPVIETDLQKVEDEAKSLVKTGETDVESFVHDIEDEAKKIADKVSGFFHHKANT